MCNNLAVLKTNCNEFFVSVHLSDQCNLLEVNDSAPSFHTKAKYSFVKYKSVSNHTITVH